MFFKTKRKASTKPKYKVVVKGITISRHAKKSTADKKARSIYSAKVVKIGGNSTRKKYSTRRRRY